MAAAERAHIAARSFLVARNGRPSRIPGDGVEIEEGNVVSGRQGGSKGRLSGAGVAEDRNAQGCGWANVALLETGLEFSPAHPGHGSNGSDVATFLDITNSSMCRRRRRHVSLVITTQQ
jgi:hypothetical protein